MNGIIENYKDFIDIGDATPISMGEGSTPLLNSNFLSKKIGADVYIKVEGCNPSGSFKDRGMVVAVCMALHRKKQVLSVLQQVIQVLSFSICRKIWINFSNNCAKWEYC